jgi:hypothetical protein
VLFLAGIISIALAIYAPRRLTPIAETPSADDDALALGSGEASPLLLTWPSQIDADAGPLEPTERLRLIESLGIVGESWCAQTLALAYREEHGEMRDAVVGAAADCLEGAGRGTLLLAIGADRPSERALAVEGFAKMDDLEPVRPLLDDASMPVAIAAAYALVRGGASADVEEYLAGRPEDDRSGEIRSVLGLLGATL